jgi:hypothetical protein
MSLLVARDLCLKFLVVPADRYHHDTQVPILGGAGSRLVSRLANFSVNEALVGKSGTVGIVNTLWSGDVAA